MTAPLRVLALRHVPFEDLGGFAPVLEARGAVCRYVEAGYDAIDPAAGLAADLLIVLGGPIGAYEEAAYPFLKDELDLLERRLAAGRPTLGVCLGGQLMARALGARVYAGGAREIGWSPLVLTEAGRRSPLAALDGAETSMLHWHGDTFDLPAGAELLASTPLYPHQAFAWGEAALGLQCHPEATARGLERWFIGHAVEIAATPGVTVPDLRADTARHAGRLEAANRRFFDGWLRRAGL